jgi:histidyl-tRNA synthetase
MGAIQALRGTRDILPSEVGYWQWVEATGRGIFARATYREIRTPTFEQTDLFERGIGEATDVVGKEMYTFLDRGDRSLTLRPEGTAGVARAYIEHGLAAQGGVQRLWYSGPMFRYERPGAGRQRQFHQLGVEVLGSADVRVDVEVIAIATDILKALGLEELGLEINSLGTAEDRQHYRAVLVEYLSQYKSELDQDSQDRLTRNPLRILDSKDAQTQKIVQDAPQILDYLSDSSRQRLEQTQALLKSLDIPYQINPRLVRGLDYYTHVAFEILTTSPELGAQATVCGGGRYDGLVEELGGPATPAVGWAMGLERLIFLLEKIHAAPILAPDFYIVSKGESPEAQALKLSQQLRQEGFSVELDLSGSAFGKQLKRADRSGAIACLILGDAEAESSTVVLKWLGTGEQAVISQAELILQSDDWRLKLASMRAQKESC